MALVQFESSYTRIEPNGTTHIMRNRLRISGTGHEVCGIIDTIADRMQLPGTTPLKLGGGNTNSEVQSDYWKWQPKKYDFEERYYGWKR